MTVLTLSEEEDTELFGFFMKGRGVPPLRSLRALRALQDYLARRNIKVSFDFVSDLLISQLEFATAEDALNFRLKGPMLYLESL